MTDEQRAMLLEIIVNPGNDVPILVYCDWLQENNKEIEAHEIRRMLGESRVYFNDWLRIKQLLGLFVDEVGREFEGCTGGSACAYGAWACNCDDVRNKKGIGEDAVMKNVDDWLKMYHRHKERQRARSNQ